MDALGHFVVVGCIFALLFMLTVVWSPVDMVAKLVKSGLILLALLYSIITLFKG